MTGKVNRTSPACKLMGPSRLNGDAMLKSKRVSELSHGCGPIQSIITAITELFWPEVQKGIEITMALMKDEPSVFDQGLKIFGQMISGS